MRKHSRKFLSVMLIALLAVTTLFLSGCGGDSGYEKQTVTLTGSRGENYWEITVTGDEVVFDETAQKDDLLVYATAKNTSEEAEVLDNDVIATVTQNGNTLYSGAEQEGFYETWNSTVEAGDSVDLVFSFELEDYSQVQIEFHGYTSYVTGGTVVFDVEGRQTEGAKAAEEAEAAKKEARNLDILYVTAEIADGWYIEESDDDSAQIKQDADNGGYLRITTVFADSPKEAAESDQSLYADSKLSTKTINGTEYQYLKINDTQFALYAQCSTGEIFSVLGMFLDLDNAMPQLEKITVK